MCSRDSVGAVFLHEWPVYPHIQKGQQNKLSETRFGTSFVVL